MEADRQPALPGTPSGLQFSTPNLQPPEVPDHVLLCLVGQGSFGEVWMARNAIGTLRAVKIVHRPRFERPEDFEREFKGLLKFEPISRSHDGLVDIGLVTAIDEAHSMVGTVGYIPPEGPGTPQADLKTIRRPLST